MLRINVRICRRNNSTNGPDVVLKDFDSVQKKDYLIPVRMEQFFTFLLSIPEDLVVDPYVAAIALIEWAVFDHCVLLSASYLDRRVLVERIKDPQLESLEIAVTISVQIIRLILNVSLSFIHKIHPLFQINTIFQINTLRRCR
jgi:hypothetical protein